MALSSRYAETNKRWRLENRERLLLAHKAWYAANKDTKRKEYREANKEKISAYMSARYAEAKRTKREDLIGKMLGNAKRRAAAKGVPFTITRNDISIPSHCPVLGIPLGSNFGNGGVGDGSPSLDRIKPELGYAPGNVMVISWRANRLKNNSTTDEMIALACFYMNLDDDSDEALGLPRCIAGEHAA